MNQYYKTKAILYGWDRLNQALNVFAEAFYRTSYEVVVLHLQLDQIPKDYFGWWLYRRTMERLEEQSWQDTLSFHSMDILGIY